MSEEPRLLNAPDSEPFRGGVPKEPEQRLPLRLSVARGALGVELYQSLQLGALEVTDLRLSLPGLRFPLDLSGGVARFRNRRGVLEHLELRVSLADLATAVSGPATAALGKLVQEPLVWPHTGGLSIGACTADRALAFNLLWVPDGDDLSLVVCGVRGVVTGTPCLAVVLPLLDTALSSFAERSGRVFRVSKVAKQVASTVLPDMGLRAPGASGLVWTSLNTEGGELALKLERDALPAVACSQAVRALELASLTRTADDLLAQGDVEGARGHYVAALERAPRHPELARAIAEIDLASGGRAEAGLSVLTESLAATEGGIIGAELLFRGADIRGAREAINLATVSEAYAPVAGLSWARLAALGGGTQERLACLDRAVAHAPSLATLRRARFEARLAREDKPGAVADAQQLEVMAHGRDARHHSCLWAAKALADAGFQEDARVFYERALRYLPEDAVATAGLARAFVELGELERGALLLGRADTLMRQSGQRQSEILLDLAEALAALGDLPQAVARLRDIPTRSPASLQARLREGAYLAKLGDLVGASRSYALMREEIEHSSEPPADASNYLVQAARFEESVLSDFLAAERHLAVALRLTPRDDRLGAYYRRIGERVATLPRPGT